MLSEQEWYGLGRMTQQPDGRIMVLLDKSTFSKLEEYAKANNARTYGDAVSKLLERT